MQLSSVGGSLDRQGRTWCAKVPRSVNPDLVLSTGRRNRGGASEAASCVDNPVGEPQDKDEMKDATNLPLRILTILHMGRKPSAAGEQTHGGNNSPSVLWFVFFWAIAPSWEPTERLVGWMA